MATMGPANAIAGPPNAFSLWENGPPPTMAGLGVASSLDQPALPADEPVELPALAAHLRAMRALLAVAQHGTTARAAEAIFLSQPAVARSVTQLEQACGVPLFTRAARGMMPTTSGTLVAERVATLLQHLGSGAAEALAAAMPAAPRGSTAPQRFPTVVSPGQLRALLAIDACGSEARAAAWLGVTQPAVHAALQGLEGSLGVRLFYKFTFGTRLTPAGEALLRRVKLALAEMRDMEGDIAAWRGEVRGRVVVGVLPLSVTIFLPRAVESLASRHPDIEIRIVDGIYQSLMKHLLSADIDVIAGALRADAPEGEVQLHHLFDDDLVVVARNAHPCLQRKALKLEHLLEWDWVTPLPGTPADGALKRLFQDQGLTPPHSNLHAGSPSMTISFVIQTGRLALTSRGQAVQDDHNGQLRIVPLPLPSTRRAIGLITRAQSRPSPDLRLFLEACGQAVRGAA